MYDYTQTKKSIKYWTKVTEDEMKILKLGNIVVCDEIISKILPKMCELCAIQW